MATGKPGSRGRQARVNILAIDVGGNATGSRGDDRLALLRRIQPADCLPRLERCLLDSLKLMVLVQGGEP
jgi:hypothetical protein